MTGRVHALGEGADGYRGGDAVVALTITGGGGYGQVAVAPAELVTPLPAGLDPVLVAAGGLGSQMGRVARLLGASRAVGVTRSEAKFERSWTWATTRPG